jgi:hypothetical protein
MPWLRRADGIEKRRQIIEYPEAEFTGNDLLCLGETTSTAAGELRIMFPVL